MDTIRTANLSNLCAVDHLGRKMPEYGEVPETSERQGKIVGLFYYLWHGYHGTEGPYDISKILAIQPDALEHPESKVWPDHTNVPMMHWAQPMFGYYQSQDEWVLRRHVQMFIDAGIDVLYFDVTNGFTYKKAYLKLFAILREYASKGFRVPQFCFYLAPNTRGSGTGNLIQLWEELYEQRLYSELYFQWKGKPLIICHSKRAIPQEIREFFTWRAPCWGVPKEPNVWAWGTEQGVAVDESGNPEQIVASVVQCACGDPDYPRKGDTESMSASYWGVPIIGRSWHDGHKDTRENATHYGFQFAEALENARRADPPVVFLCQWNEWLVPFLRRDTAYAPVYDSEHVICFRDEFTEEYSRDIEPMKGGYKDAYYLQMASFCRTFKGLDKPETANGFHTIPMTDDFAGWDAVSPVYREYTGDTSPRYFKGYDAAGIYTNNTGRNEFASLRVACDGKTVYFQASCTSPITKREKGDENRMLLFLHIRGLNAPSWERYHFVINRLAKGSDEVSVERCAEDGCYRWEETAVCRCVCRGNEMQIAIDRQTLGIPDGGFTIEFKWSDNMQENDVMDFYQNGDCAPRGRMNYLFIKE